MWNGVGHSGASWEMMTAAQRRRGRVFLGEYSHSMDGKGRVVMPSKFRSGLEEGCVVTKGQERCIYVFPMDRWEEESGKVLQLPRTDRRARNISRSFFASASDQPLDRQGRVQIPEADNRVLSCTDQHRIIWADVDGFDALKVS